MLDKGATMSEIEFQRQLIHAFPFSDYKIVGENGG